MCAHWPHHGKQCLERALFWIVAPDGERVPGSGYCKAHGLKVINELADKSAEIWTLQPIDEYGRPLYGPHVHPTRTREVRQHNALSASAAEAEEIFGADALEEYARSRKT